MLPKNGSVLLSSLVEGPQTHDKLSLGKRIEKEVDWFVCT